MKPQTAWPAAATLIVALSSCWTHGTPAAASADGSFPPGVYPPAASFPDWGPSNGCASLRHVDPVPGNAEHASLRVVSLWGHISKDKDLHLSDRAEWPVVQEQWAHRSGPPHPLHLRPFDVVQGQATRAPQAGLVRDYCGNRLLHRSWWVHLCQGGPYSQQTPCTLRSSPSLAEDYLLLHRRGHWLVWFTYP